MASAKRKRLEVKATAIHEAGHAVAAYFLRVRIKHVTIAAADDYLGKVTAQPVRFGRHGVFDDSVAGTDRAERHIMVCFAGSFAERKFAPRSHWRIGASADNSLAMELFSHVAHPDEKVRNLQLALLRRRTESFVEGRWKQICAVAEKLLTAPTLSADQVAATIDESMGLEPFKL